MSRVVPGANIMNPVDAADAVVVYDPTTGAPVSSFGGTQYAEDSAHSSGDFGTTALAVRKDTAVATGADGDYVPLIVDSTGRQWVHDSSTVGCVASATFTPAAAAYGAGDIMDVAKEFAFTYADGTAIPTGSLIRILDTIVKIDTTGLQASEGAYTLYGYGVTPPSAQADNDLWTLASADLPSFAGSISLGTPVDLGAALHIKQSNIDVDIKLTTSSLWGRLVTVAGFTPTAVGRQVLLRAIVL